jgi:HSP20 family protein
MLELTPFERGTYDWLSPLQEFERRLSGSERFATAFRTDIRDAGDSFILEAELPGFSKEDIHVDVDPNCLKISAERKSDTKRDNQGYLCRERSMGTCSRSFRISGIKNDEITASYQSGVLHLILPKQKEQEESTRRLDIQ